MKYRHHKYTWAKPFTSVRHNWELVGPLGGVNFHVHVTEQYPDSAGLEFHHTEACGWNTDEAPHHVDCPLTGGRCWHDGTSSYATDELWPEIKAYLRGGEHEKIFRVLEREADRHFEGYEMVRRRAARVVGIGVDSQGE